jgi:hypothetical protein
VPADPAATRPPSIRLAVGGQPGPVALGKALGTGSSRDGELPPPALLVSYVYLAPFDRHRTRYRFRDYVLDSGGYSAWKIGTTIDLDAYTELCAERLATDPQLTEVFSLDVVGDWRAGMRNLERMWSKGVPAIPTYHVGEPDHVLTHLAKHYPKLALGGAVGYRHKLDWARQCFARVWPAKVHGLGFCGEQAVMALPWHSVDATNWELGPAKYGRWESFGKLSVRGSSQNLRAEIEHYLRLERRARRRWARQMAELEQVLHAAGECCPD